MMFNFYRIWVVATPPAVRLRPAGGAFWIQNIDSKPVGVVTWSPQDGEIWLSWKVDEVHRRQGFATAAVRQLNAYLRAHGYREAWALIRPGNEASRRLAAKCGAELVTEDTENGTWRFRL